MSTRAESPPPPTRPSRRLGLALIGAVLPLLATFFVLTPTAKAATFTEVGNFGNNPSNLRMHVYVPDSVQQTPPVLLAIHYCTGSGQAFYSGTEFARLADQYGFIVIYPTATRSGSCFDVWSQQSLSGTGSDSVSLRSMVSYVETTYAADPDRIFVTGASSGAMMTNVMAAVYPDVFAAGAPFMGVPHTCFQTTSGEWNSQCANGQINLTPQEWGDRVRQVNPGYSGPWPRMQIWHGDQDTTLRYPNFQEQIDQWTNVHGLSTTPTATDSPVPGQTRTRYGDAGGQAPVEAISIAGVGHALPQGGQAAEVIRFFGLDQPADGEPTDPTDPPGEPTDPPGDGDAACQVSVTTNAWDSGLTHALTITNSGGAVVTGWSLDFTLPAGQTITSGWNATYAPTTGTVTATNAAHNGTIAPGESVSIGFQASHSGNDAAPSAFALNGADCA